jgi:hypothetical protein
LSGVRLAVVLALALCALAALSLPPASADGPRRAGHRAGVTEGLDCGACHSPHGWKTLADGAGGGFDHARTGFPLTGRHARVACSDCHRAGVQVSRECSSCHRDAHERSLGAECAECHSSLSWQRVEAFERHRRTRLPLTGMHALADCTDCHRRTTDRQWSSVAADCYACHADDYRRTDVHPLHVGGVGDPPSAPFSRDCAECHRASAWSPAVIARDAFALGASAALGALSIAPAAHESVFPIRRGAHRAATCEDCHAHAATPRAVRCVGCHAHDPLRLRAQHRGDPLVAQGACLGCHPGGMAR